MKLKGTVVDSNARTRPSATLSRAAGEGRGKGASRAVLLVLALALCACSPKGEELYQRAEQSLDKGAVRAALIDLKNLVKDEPQNGKARALLAAALIESGELSAATIELQKAKDLGAPPDAVLGPECRAMVARGEFDAVLANCKTDDADARLEVAMHIVRGQALLGLERPAEAKPHFEKALEANASSLPALLGLASAAYATDGLAAARAVLDKASAEAKDKPKYWMALGGVNAEGGDFAAAEQSFQKAADIAPKNAEPVTRLMAWGALAEVQMQQGKVEAARETTDRMVKAAPDNPLVKQLRGKVEAAAGNLDEARTLLEEAVAAMPDNYEARTLLGMVNLKQGNLGQAEMHFQNVLANQPRNVRVQRLLIETRAQLQTPAEALESLKSTLGAEGADPSLLAMAGRMSLASGDRDQALSYFQQAAAQTAEQAPADVQLELAAGYLAAGDLDGAVELLEKIPEGGATDLQREYLLLAALLRKGENEKAIAEARAFAERRGDDVLASNVAAGVYAAAGKRDEARQQFAQSLKLKPGDATTLISLGLLELAEQKPGEAARYFQQVLDADPTNLRATVGLAAAANAQGNAADAEKWLKKASTDHPQSVEAQVPLAHFYLTARDFGKVKAIMEETLKTAPDNAALLNALGLAQLGLNDVPGAIASVKRAHELSPKTLDYGLNLARAYAFVRDTSAALAVLDGVLRTEPRYLPALVLASSLALNGGQTEKAAGYIERLRRVAPETPGTLTLEGDLAMAQKRYKDAGQLYRRAGSGGRTPQLVMSQFRADRLAGETTPEKVLEGWLAENPDSFEISVLLGQYHESRGNLADAQIVYERALERAPGNAVLLNNLAVIYQAQGNPDALSLAEKAYQAAPDAGAIQDTYGWLLFEAGRNDEAVRLLREALKNVPGNAEIQYHLAAALAKAGNKTEAAALAGKAVRGQLPPAQKAEAQKLLGSLGQ